jgi:hypothetical protein
MAQPTFSTGCAINRRLATTAVCRLIDPIIKPDFGWASCFPKSKRVKQRDSFCKGFIKSVNNTQQEAGQNTMYK